MDEVIRFSFPADADRKSVEGDVSLALFSAECVHGRPQVRLETSYRLNADGSRCAFRVRGPAGATAVQVFLGLCEERFGAGRFSVQHIAAAGFES